MNIENILPIDEVQSKDYYRNNPTAKTNYLDAIDAATLLPIAGLTAKAGIKGGSWGLSKIFDRKKQKFPDDLLDSKGKTRQQIKIDYFDFLNKPSVFEKQILKNKKINPDAKIYHEHNTLDKVVKSTVPYEKDLNITLNRVTEKVAPNAEVVTRTKKPEKIDLKLGGGRKPENISDVVGGRITVDSVDEINTVIKELDNNANIIKVDNFYDPIGTKDGYRGVHVQIQNSKGGSAEVQILPKDFVKLNDAGKNYYNAIKYGLHGNSFNKLKNILLNKNSQFQKDELFKKLQHNQKNNTLKNSYGAVLIPRLEESGFFPTYRGLLSK